MVKGIERRVQSLSGVLASPASQDDDAEKVRRMELRGFVLGRILRVDSLIPFRRLEGIIAKLEPLIEQDTLVRFLRNVENAKMLTGFIQELIDAVANYQVRTSFPTLIFDEHPVSFQYNKEYTKGQGISVMTPGTSAMTLRTSAMTLMTFTMTPRTSVAMPGIPE